MKTENALSKDDEKRLYLVWWMMKSRCQKPKTNGYKRYGGRGIKVCREWQAFPPFRMWAILAGYRHGLEIDRIDNDGNYEPENCRWITHVENSHNRSSTKLSAEKAAEIRRLLAEGVSGPRIARQFGVHHSMIYYIKSNKQWREATA